MKRFGSRLCKECDLGVGRVLYGGRLLEWLAEQAALYAMAVTGETRMVGYRFDDIVIKRPAAAGEVLDFFMSEAEFGTSSVVFDLEIRVGDAVVLSGRCRYVAVDADGAKKRLDIKST